MTHYFDLVDQALHTWRKDLAALDAEPDPAREDRPSASLPRWKTFQTLEKRLADLEDELVWDVTVAAESPGFPEDLRHRVHLLVVEHAVFCRPANDDTHPRVNSLPDAEREVGHLSGHLHTLFHELAERKLDGFSDSPLSPVRVLFTRGDAYREDLVEQRKKPGPGT